MMSGVSYAGTVRQLTVTSSAADSRAPIDAANRCQSPKTVSTPAMTCRKATVSPAPMGCARARSRSGSAMPHGWSEASQVTIEPRLPPSK